MTFPAPNIRGDAQASSVFPFYVSGRGSGGDGASGGGLVLDDVLIDGGDGWWLECSITRENRERLGPPEEE